MRKVANLTPRASTSPRMAWVVTFWSCLAQDGEQARRLRTTVMVSLPLMMVPAVSGKRRWMVSGVAVA